MLDLRTRTIQRKIKAAGEDILKVQQDIGALLSKRIEPGDAGIIFRCKLLLNRCSSIDESLTKLGEDLPQQNDTAVTRSLCIQNKQLIELQKSTINSLLDSMKKIDNALDEAKRMELLSESLRLGERIKKNVRKNP